MLNFLGKRSSLLSQWGVLENDGVRQTLYRIMRVDFQDFGIFDHEQYCQGPKFKLLENSRPTALSQKHWSLVSKQIWKILSNEVLNIDFGQGAAKISGVKVGGQENICKFSRHRVLNINI